MRVISNRGLRHGLTDAGYSQATALAQRLKECRIIRLFTSPLLRAMQTAEVLVHELGIPYMVTDALREYDCGVMEGRSDESAWETYEEVLQDWVNGHWERRIEQGESLEEIKARFVPFVEGLVKEYQGSEAGTVLVGHGGLYRCTLPLVLENVDLKYALAHPIGPTEYVVAEERAGRLVCVTWCGRGGVGAL